jgi:hypothetical protein
MAVIVLAPRTIRLEIVKARLGANQAISGAVLGVHGLFTNISDTVNRFLSAIASWLRAGYPEGVPPTDYMPVLALLSRRLTTDQVKTVASELMQPGGHVDDIDIGVAITQITDELPSPEDIERVRQRLAANGWPLDDPRDNEDSE